MYCVGEQVADNSRLSKGYVMRQIPGAAGLLILVAQPLFAARPSLIDGEPQKERPVKSPLKLLGLGQRVWVRRVSM